MYNFFFFKFLYNFEDTVICNLCFIDGKKHVLGGKLKKVNTDFHFLIKQRKEYIKIEILENTQKTEVKYIHRL